MRTALVTGATGIIGKAIVTLLSKTDRIQVVPSGRNQEKIRVQYSGVRGRILEGTIIDQGSSLSIQELAGKWKIPLHILIINASATPLHREVTSEGIEVQWAVNVLGYHRLIKHFSPLLYRSSMEVCEPSRIVIVASGWAGELDLNDPEFKRRKYENGTAYRQSKQAERMLAATWAVKLKNLYGSIPTGRFQGCPFITVNACHPGEVNTPLSNSLGFGGHETPEEGADTPVWAATSNELASITGGWFTYRKQSTCRFSTATETSHQLWDLLERSG